MEIRLAVAKDKKEDPEIRLPYSPQQGGRMYLQWFGGRVVR